MAFLFSVLDWSSGLGLGPGRGTPIINGGKKNIRRYMLQLIFGLS